MDCHQTFPLEQFPLRSNGRGGFTRKKRCIECWKKEVKRVSHNGYLRYRSNPDRYAQRLQKDRERYKLYYETRYKDKKLNYNKHIRPKHLKEAHNAVQNAIQRGELVRPDTCSACGSNLPVEAHHDDYTKVLDVRWLCRPCHSKHHRKINHDHGNNPIHLPPSTLASQSSTSSP